MGNYCRNKQLEYSDRGLIGRWEAKPDNYETIPAKRLKTETDVIEMHCAFIRASYTRDPDLPKSQLIAWTLKNKIEKPRYEIINEEKLFRAIVTVNGVRYSSSYW